MVSLMSCAFSGVKSRLACLCRSHGQIANPDIDTDDFMQALRSWLRNLNFYREQQIELFLATVIPEFSIPNVGTLLNEGGMLVVALVGNADASVERTNTDPA